MIPTQTVYWCYRVGGVEVTSNIPNGVELDKFISELLQRGVAFQDITIQVTFGGATTA